MGFGVSAYPLYPPTITKPSTLSRLTDSHLHPELTLYLPSSPFPYEACVNGDRPFPPIRALGSNSSIEIDIPTPSRNDSVICLPNRGTAVRNASITGLIVSNTVGGPYAVVPDGSICGT